MFVIGFSAGFAVCLVLGAIWMFNAMNPFEVATPSKANQSQVTAAHNTSLNQPHGEV